MSHVEVALFAVVAFHALFDAELEVAFYKGRDLGNGLVKGRAVFGRELRQHPVAQVILGRALTYAEADSRELVTHMLNDIAESVLATVTTILAATDSAYVQINVIAENEKMVYLHLVPSHERLNRFSRQIHISLRLCQQAFFAYDVHLHGERLMFAFPVLVRVSQFFNRHKARVVVSVSVLSTRISKTDDDVHNRYEVAPKAL